MENWVGPGNEASSSQSSFIPRLTFCIPASFLFNICTYVVSISLAYLCIITDNIYSSTFRKLLATTRCVPVSFEEVCGLGMRLHAPFHTN